MWSCVVFSDETSFEVHPMKRNMHVWRMNGKRFDTFVSFLLTSQAMNL